MADSIKIGNLDISSFKVDSDDCKIYLGDTLLYPSTPTPTPTWTLVDDAVSNPSKIKVVYSLIDDDDSELRDDYQLNSHDFGTYEIMYLNQPTLEWMIEQGYGGDELVDYYQKVGLFSDSDGIIGILEDGVEYTSIGGITISDMDITPLKSNYYLYATQ